MKYCRSKKVLIGLTYLIILLISSFSLNWFFPDLIPQPLKLLYDNNGNLIATPPFSPNEMPPFGSNKLGENLFYQIIEGAKYTLCLVILISLMRLVLGFLFGIVYAYWLIPYKRWLNGLFQVFYYIPTALLAYFLLRPLQGVAGNSQEQYILFQVLVLVFVVLPPISVLLGEEIYLLLQEDFITASRLMGASRYWLLSKQLYPFLIPRMMIFFMEQVVQVLTLFTHLGILRIFLGGQINITMDNEGTREAFSLSNEWSGLIGKDFYALSITPWVVLIPLVFFAFTILSCNLILNGLKERTLERTTDQKTMDSKLVQQGTEKNLLFELSERE